VFPSTISPTEFDISSKINHLILQSFSSTISPPPSHNLPSSNNDQEEEDDEMVDGGGRSHLIHLISYLRDDKRRFKIFASQLVK